MVMAFGKKFLHICRKEKTHPNAMNTPIIASAQMLVAAYTRAPVRIHIIVASHNDSNAHPHTHHTIADRTCVCVRAKSASFIWLKRNEIAHEWHTPANIISIILPILVALNIIGRDIRITCYSLPVEVVRIQAMSHTRNHLQQNSFFDWHRWTTDHFFSLALWITICSRKGIHRWHNPLMLFKAMRHHWVQHYKVWCDHLRFVMNDDSTAFLPNGKLILILSFQLLNK